jgi:hypothetical protein
MSSSTDSFGFPTTHSRYKNDFEELEELGSGGFGIVVKARILSTNTIITSK